MIPNLISLSSYHVLRMSRYKYLYDTNLPRYLHSPHSRLRETITRVPALKLVMMALNAIMRGVLYSGIPYQVTVGNLPIPTIQNQTDVIVRITTAAICGSDLHMYHGLQGGTPPWGMGHEAVGYISEVGSAVSSLSVGDYVVIPDNLAPPHIVGPSGSAAENSFGIGFGLGGLQCE